MLGNQVSGNQVSGKLMPGGLGKPSEVDPRGGLQGDRPRLLLRALLFATVLLVCKVLVETVYEYRWYFPADFVAADFLMGREPTFFGMYRAAFYTHIISGPITILLGGGLILTSGISRLASWHRIGGRVQILLVLALVTPSGLIMSTQAFTGAIAGVGFAAHSIITAAAAIAAIHFAQRRQFSRHRRWATRCFLLLCSPLLLRVISGATIVIHVDSDLTYQVTAWLSWLMPLIGYECWARCLSSRILISRILGSGVSRWLRSFGPTASDQDPCVEGLGSERQAR